MSDQNDLQALMREGIEAAREGNRAKARRLFEQVVKEDDENEKVWFWLASVLDNPVERRRALTRVLELNPNNERAQKALDKLGTYENLPSAEENEVLPGVSRRQLLIAAGAGGGALLLLLLVLLFTSLSNNARQAEIANQTAVAQAAIVEQTNVALQAAQTATEIANVTATAFALTSPTPEPFVPRRTLPPTFTPTPTFTPEGGAAATALPFPAGLTGTFVGWGGRDIQSVGYLPPRLYDLNTGVSTVINDELVLDVRISSDGLRVLYTRYDRFLFSSLVETSTIDGLTRELLSERWQAYGGLIDQAQPDFSLDGSKIVFVARSANAAPGTQVRLHTYLLDLSVPPDVNPLRELTTDDADYSYPTFSPDAAQVAVIRTVPTGSDIVVIDIATGAQRPVTSDLSTFAETTPRWSPDGLQIAYASAPLNDLENHDLYLRNADGSGIATRFAESAGNDFHPVFSPDNRFIAFASDRGGQYDIFIHEVATGTLYQLTNSPDPDYPGGWYQRS